MNRELTPQEEFWKGEFGNSYIDRNASEQLLASNTAFFSRVLSRTGQLDSIIEFGCNVGMNLKALKTLLPQSTFHGVEINDLAVKKLRASNPEFHITLGSISDYKITNQQELALICGVLIHINPDQLTTVYDKLFHAASKYICIAEYYNPTPTVIPKRGHGDRLFKRDFAGEFMEQYPNSRLIDYGFLYHRDPCFPQDDLTWFLIEK